MVVRVCAVTLLFLSKALAREWDESVQYDAEPKTGDKNINPGQFPELVYRNFLEPFPDPDARDYPHAVLDPELFPGYLPEPEQDVPTSSLPGKILPGLGNRKKLPPSYVPPFLLP